MANILVFGASTTYGAWDPEGGWVTRLRKFLDQKTISSKQEFYCTVYNLGVSGDSTDGVHENALGHELVFEEVKQYLLNNRIIEL